MPVKIAINGYGRIGRDLHRQLLEVDDIEVVAINSRADAKSHAYLLEHDSLYGHCKADISVDGDNLIVNGKKVFVYQIKDPADLKWGDHDVDVVIESTGKFTAREKAENHLKAGAKKVLITAPCKDVTIPNIVMGVNEKEFDADKEDVVSNASCTTNCLAPMLHVLHQEFGVKQALVTTIHAFTYTQNLLDNSNPEDFRRARATTESIIPTTTGAMKAISRVIPDLKGRVEGMAFRVPVPTVSVIDAVCLLDKEVNEAQVNAAFEKHASGDMKGVLAVSDKPLVSVDYRGNTHSCTIDGLTTKVLDDGMVKVIGWYDNEWGYVARIIDLLRWFV